MTTRRAAIRTRATTRTTTWPTTRTTTALFIAATVSGTLLASLGVHATSPLPLTPRRETPVAVDSKIAVKNVRASSTLPPSKIANYEAKNVLDNNPSTVWCEGAAGAGHDASLVFELGGVPLNGSFTVSLRPGHQREASTFHENAVPTRMRVTAVTTTATLEPIAFTLVDMPSAQSISLPVPPDTVLTRLSFEILDVRRGAKYDDACIADVSFTTPSPLRAGKLIVLPSRVVDEKITEGECRGAPLLCLDDVGVDVERRALADLSGPPSGTPVAVTDVNRVHRGGADEISLLALRVCPAAGDPGIDDDIAVSLAGFLEVPTLSPRAAHAKIRGAPDHGDGERLMFEEGELTDARCEVAVNSTSSFGGDAIVFSSHVDGVEIENGARAQPFSQEIRVRLDYDDKGRLQQARALRTGSTVGISRGVAHTDGHSGDDDNGGDCTCGEPDVHPLVAIEIVDVIWKNGTVHDVRHRTLHALGAEWMRVERAYSTSAKIP